MSVEIGDYMADGMSSCCSGAVIDPSGENIEGRCKDCGEMCSVVGYETTIEVTDLSIEQRYKFIKQNTLTDKRKAESVRAGVL